MANKRCMFCRKKIDVIDFRMTSVLAHFLSGWAKMKTTRDTGACAKHQRGVARAIKRARFMALLPYISR